MITGVITARYLLSPALLLVLSSLVSPAPAAQPSAAPLFLASAAAPQAAPASTTPQQQVGILSAAATEKLLPNAVLFKGQLAPVQARNSGAIRHADYTLTIASMVDSSGYSTGVRERFQFFLYTETSLQLAADKVLPPGFYGAGFLADNTMVVLNVASRDVMTVPTTVDSSLTHPRPLQIMSAASNGETRLYLGRSYIALRTLP